MSIFKAIKKFKPLRALGKVAKLAAPVLAATGVGAPLALAIGAGGNLLDKGKRVGLKDFVKTGVGVAGGSLAGKALGTTGLLRGGGGLRGIASRAGSVARAAPGRVAGLVGKRILGGDGTAASAEPSAPGGGLLQRVGDFITSDPLRAAQLGFGAVNAVQGAKASGQANRMRQAALARVATQPPREDLSALYADSGNPYSRPGTGTSKRAAVRALGY
jgi:hypothetical protein